MLVHKPGASLARFVNVLWLSQGYVPGPHRQERLLPGADCALILDLREGNRHPILSGPHSRFFLVDTADQFSLAGVSFKPGGAFPFLGAPMCEFANAHIMLEDVWGAVAVELRQRVLEARTPEGKLGVLEALLVARLACAPKCHPAVGYALDTIARAPAATTIARLTDRVGLSHRRFLDLFTAEVGVTPKVFSRLRRFQGALRCANAGGAVDWTTVALTCGYYDQAHFIHDFRAFSGISPTTYERQRVNGMHVAIPD
jgi:AraC-like DNA-binding protein